MELNTVSTLSLQNLDRVMDEQDLIEYKARTRTEFENKVRMQVHHIGTWMKYAIWEANLKEFVRSRSIFERAIEVEYQNVTLWLKSAEMEMKNRFINHARNVWERACKYLPRTD